MRSLDVKICKIKAHQGPFKFRSSGKEVGKLKIAILVICPTLVTLFSSIYKNSIGSTSSFPFMTFLFLFYTFFLFLHH